jgi:hypothetical protein
MFNGPCAHATDQRLPAPANDNPVRRRPAHFGGILDVVLHRKALVAVSSMIARAATTLPDWNESERRLRVLCIG